MKNLYSILFQGKIGRLKFFLITFCIFCLSIIFLFPISEKYFGLDLNSTWQKFLLFYIIYIPIIILASKRLRDMNLSPFLSFLILLNPIGKIGNLIGGSFYIFLIIKKNFITSKKLPNIN
jgi:uncharacterized membrane protein YhaH (DUF805 family)